MAQARLQERDDEQIVHLLAVRLAWEWLLHEGHPELAIAGKLTHTWRNCAGLIQQTEAALTQDWLWQAALERTYQETLCRGLMTAATALPNTTAPAV
jgi:hypothetical protein